MVCRRYSYYLYIIDEKSKAQRILYLKTQPNKPQSLSNLMVPQILDGKSVVSVTHFPLVIVSSYSFLLDAIFFLFNSIHSEDQWLVT